MQVESQIDYAAIAAARWPVTAASGRIFGNGRYAITVVCSRKVMLFETKEQCVRKMIALDHGCGSTKCSSAHAYVDLQGQ